MPSRTALRRWSVLLAPAVVLIAVAFARRWVADDGFIYLRVVDQLLAGNGPVFNVGERVEAFTSPAWFAILAFGGALGLRPEYVAVIAGLACGFVALAGIAGLGMADEGDREPGRVDPQGVVPLGALLFLAIPTVWDFTTSGLEVPLIWAWLAAGYRATRSVFASARCGWTEAIVVGLGPLVRPELAIYSVGWLLLIGWRLRVGRTPWRRIAALCGVAVALPVAYQVFRMGYYGCLVPTTAIAKGAGEAHWARGWRYLVDFAAHGGPVWLVGSIASAFVIATRSAGRRWVDLTTLGIVCVHCLYVIRVGGDFMHARMWLPAVFATFLPCGVLSFGGARTARYAPAGCALFALGAVLVLPQQLDVDPRQHMIVNERAHRLRHTLDRHPVTIETHPEFEWGRRIGREASARCSDGACRPTYFRNRGAHPLSSSRTESFGALVSETVTGGVSYAAGPLVFVHDRHGLGDAVAARNAAWNEYDRAGHDRVSSAQWAALRYADSPREAGAVPHWQDAQEAYGCGLLAELVAATMAPLDFRRFVANLRAAPRLTRFRFPDDPRRARDALCGS